MVFGTLGRFCGIAPDTGALFDRIAVSTLHQFNSKEKLMRSLYPRLSPVAAFVLILSWSIYFGSEARSQQVRMDPGTGISFQTEDGWTIHGTLYPPTKSARGAVPGVILVSEPGMRIRTIFSTYPTKLLRESNMVVLTIDPRGTAASHGNKDFEQFTMKELDGFQLDIRGAVKFLASQKEVDSNRIAVVAASLVANYAVLEASENSAIKALALLSATELSRRARDYIKYRKDIPVLCILGKSEEKTKQLTAMQGYLLSENKNSDLVFGIGHGLLMFHRPGGIDEKLAKWLTENLRGLGTETEVSFTSDDGWTLHGILYLPDGANENSKVPGVVFVHGFNHDQQQWYPLEQEVVRKGMAALLFDWRGTRSSIDEKKGEIGVNLAPQETDKVYLDVKAAINFFASQKQVDANRIGLIASTATCNHAVQAAIGDSRIKTIVGMSFYAPSPEVRKALPTMDIPIMIIASSEDVNPDGGSLAEGSKEVYGLTKNKASQLMMFDDAGRGASMALTYPSLQPMIVRWFSEKLAK